MFAASTSLNLQPDSGGALQGVQNNGTLYLHAYAARHGKTIDSRNPDYDGNSVTSKRHRELNSCSYTPQVPIPWSD